MTVLMVSAGLIPYDTCSALRSVWMLYDGSGHSVQDSERIVRSPGREWVVPSVLRIPSMSYVPMKTASFTRLNVLYRDDQTCQYCGVGPLPVNRLQMEHVVPQSRFAEIARKRHLHYAMDSFENCVAACVHCNSMKRNLTLEESGMRLLRKPFQPKYRPYLMVSRKEARENGWEAFLEPFVPTFVKLY